MANDTPTTNEDLERKTFEGKTVTLRHDQELDGPMKDWAMKVGVKALRVLNANPRPSGVEISHQIWPTEEAA